MLKKPSIFIELIVKKHLDFEFALLQNNFKVLKLFTCVIVFFLI